MLQEKGGEKTLFSYFQQENEASFICTEADWSYTVLSHRSRGDARNWKR